MQANRIVNRFMEDPVTSELLGKITSQLVKRVDISNSAVRERILMFLARSIASNKKFKKIQDTTLYRACAVLAKYPDIIAYQEIAAKMKVSTWEVTRTLKMFDMRRELISVGTIATAKKKHRRKPQTEAPASYGGNIFSPWASQHQVNNLLNITAKLTTQVLEMEKRVQSLQNQLSVINASKVTSNGGHSWAVEALTNIIKDMVK